MNLFRTISASYIPLADTGRDVGPRPAPTSRIRHVDWIPTGRTVTPQKRPARQRVLTTLAGGKPIKKFDVPP
jgi:hypothetical protein